MASRVTLGLAAFLLAGIIAILSLAPVERIPRIGPSIVEHGIAYGGALAVLLALAEKGRPRRVIAIAATSAAGLLEVVQPLFGREAALLDFLGSAAGVWLAYAVVAAADGWRRR